MPDGGTAEELERKTQLIIRALARKTAQARRDPAALYELIMRTTVGWKPLKIAPHQRLMIEFMEAHPKCLIRAPVEFGKSYVTTNKALHVIGNDPSERCVVIGAVQPMAEKTVNLIRQYIDTSDELTLVFPGLVRSTRIGEPWSQQRITVQREGILKDPTVAAYGDGGKLAGSRVSWFLCDDLLHEKNTYDQASRDKTWHWFNSSVLDRMDAVGARFVVVNTPWYPDDLTYKLEGNRDMGLGLEWPSLTLDAYGDIVIRNTDWDTDLIRPTMQVDPLGERHRLAAHDAPAYAVHAGEEPSPDFVDTDDQVPLWPEVWSRQKLDEKMLSMEGWGFNRAYRCKVRDDKLAPVKREWIDECKRKAREFKESYLPSEWAGHFPTFTGVDPAFGEGKKSDKSALVTFTVLPNMHRRLLNVQVGRWPGPELVTRILDTSKRFNSIVAVESNAAQRLLVQWSRERDVGALVRAVNTGKEKTSSAIGVISLFMEIENGAWLFPNDEQTGRCHPSIQELIDELINLTPNPKHVPDVIMAMWIAQKYARKIGAFTRDDTCGGAGLAAALAR